jgi:hypothetical protein
MGRQASKSPLLYFGTIEDPETRIKYLIVLFHHVVDEMKKESFKEFIAFSQTLQTQFCQDKPSVHHFP